MALCKSITVFILLSLFHSAALSHQEGDPHEEELVELIFLLDSSGSISNTDFVLQQQGFKKAFDDLLLADFGKSIKSTSVIYFSSSSTIAGERIPTTEGVRAALSVPRSSGSTNMTATFGDAISIVNRIPTPDPDGHSIKKLVILSTDGQPNNANTAFTRANELSGLGVTLASIGVGSANQDFLDSISSNPPVPRPADFTEFGREVTKLILGQLSTALGRPVVTDLVFNAGINGEAEFRCDGVAPGEVITGYKFEIFDASGNSLGSPVVNQTGNHVFSFPNEGVFSASCTLVSSDGNASHESEPRFVHVPIVYGDLSDSDGDGLPDTWEINGVKDSDGNILVNLPEMGANPQCKDIFLEVDWIENSRPSRATFGWVIEAFALAPVENPGGNTCRGVNLHIDAGEGMLLHHDASNDKIENQGYLPGGGRITAMAALTDGLYDKNISKDVWLRLQRDGFTENRRGVFRYALIVPYREKTDFSGVAYSAPSPGFMSMGEPWDDKKIASTFMHELGHALGLGHGGAYQVGDPDTENYKPNYLSIMNYHFSHTWLGKEKLGFGFNSMYLDYSRWTTIDLDENHLDERIGIGIKAPSNDLIAIDRLNAGLSTKHSCNVIGVLRYYSDAEGNINWNCNLSKNESDVKKDINYDKDNNNKGALTILAGQQRTDWESIDYAGKGIAGLGLAGSSIGIMTPFELELRPYDPDEEKRAPDNPPMAYDVYIAGNDIYEVTPGERHVIKFSITNTGELEDSYNLSIEDAPDSIVAEFGDDVVLMAAHSSGEADLSLAVSETAKAGDEYQITISANSVNNAVVTDSVGITIRVVEAPATSSGGGGSLGWLILFSLGVFVFSSFARRKVVGINR